MNTMLKTKESSSTFYSTLFPAFICAIFVGALAGFSIISGGVTIVAGFIFAVCTAADDKVARAETEKIAFIGGFTGAVFGFIIGIGIKALFQINM